MVLKKTKARVDLSEENWSQLFGINRIYESSYNRKQPISYENPWLVESAFLEFDLSIIARRVMPVLIDIGFFDKTPYKEFALVPIFCFAWDNDTDVSFWVSKGSLCAKRKIYFQDFRYMNAVQFLDYLTAVAAEVILAACQKYRLDPKPAQALLSQFTVPKSEFSLVTFESELPVIEPSKEQLLPHLTNAELTFPDFNSYSWCVQGPFTEAQMDKIGPDTLNVCVPLDLHEDQYVEIANAMLRAPSAVLRVQEVSSTGYAPGDLHFLKYFRHLARVCIDLMRCPDLSDLRYLSHNLIRLELNFSSSLNRPSLVVLDSFQSLQSLSLIGHYEDLSKFSGLRSLRALRLQDVTLKNLSSLAELESLQSLALVACKIQDMSQLVNIDRLKYLELAFLPKIEQLEQIAHFKYLEYLELAGLSKLTRLPSLEGLVNLRRLSLSSLKHLDELAGAAQAPNLEELLLFDLKQLKPPHVQCFLGHQSLKGLRTDNIAIERALGLSRAGTAKVFEFSAYTPVVPVSKIESAMVGGGDSLVDSTADFVSDEALLDESKQELHVHIRISSEFAKADEWQLCCEIEEHLEKILETDLLGRWDGQEIGGGYYTIFFVGADGKAMYEALKIELLSRLPKGSYIEIEDADDNVIKIEF